jgi:hypothetical protein
VLIKKWAKKKKKEEKKMLGTVVHACNPNTLEARRF